MDTFVDIYATKGIEYLIAVAYIFSFIFFWRFLTAKEALKLPESVMELKRKAGELVEWFLLPERLYFHPGHSWVKVESDDTVTVGIDDFAQKLVGGIDGINLPAIGSSTLQGEKGWSLKIDKKQFNMVAPVSGEILSVNHEAKELPGKINKDPYGEGWLFKAKVPNLKANLTNLISGSLAKKWITDACENLRLRTGMDAGLVYQDGGLPVEGIAKNLNPDAWEQIVSEFFLTMESEK